MNPDRIFPPLVLTLAIAAGLLGWTQGGGFEHRAPLRGCLDAAGQAAHWGQRASMDCRPLAR